MSENKTITSLNQLKNWFKTGLKPTQAQFWAWLDSFYHKDEEIPQDKISGLAETLENKAETSDLEAKANADASGLSDDEKEAWKEALGVGELPINIATIDQAEEQGNVYTKEQTNTLLENSGKNLGNTDLRTTGVRTFTQGYNFTHHTAGFYYYLTGLADKSSDATFSQMLVEDTNGQVAKSNGKAVLESLMSGLEDKTNGHHLFYYPVFDPITGKMAKSSKPQVVTTFNVPTHITINHTFSEPHKINVIYPEGTHPVSEDVKKAISLYERIKTLEFTKFRTEDLVFTRMKNELLPISIRNTSYDIPNTWYFKEDGRLAVKRFIFHNDFNDNQYLVDHNFTVAAQIQFNRPFPTDRDWIIKFITYRPFPAAFTSLFFKNELSHTERIDPVTTPRQINPYHAYNEISKFKINGEINEVVIIKTGSVLTVISFDIMNGTYRFNATLDYQDTYKYLTFAKHIEIRRHNWLDTHEEFDTLFNFSYWIQP